MRAFNDSEESTDMGLDTWSSCCIGVLIFALILLLVLVLIL